MIFKHSANGDWGLIVGNASKILFIEDSDTEYHNGFVYAARIWGLTRQRNPFLSFPWWRPWTGLTMKPATKVIKNVILFLIILIFMIL